ncbi:hypothetical protein QMO56_18385 [Roseomonas sp. E05]|uniref:hypothetical protein n=1 Tax=Roseomonas sp. E05 TaxID=3046310 RepID=UPI0024BA1FFE|nr:hypothetical protein [Roseomonas sp. E05]MDJ0390081.1 hypothetical protein [Roseomonas sp. E05]
MLHSSVPANTGTSEPEEAHPVFVRRCAHRGLNARAPSEKLGRTVSWTTTAQGFLVNLMEVTHSVVHYQPWAHPVTIRAGWGEPFEYWPALGVTGATGRRIAIDIVYERDGKERESLGFERLLEAALASQGVQLTAMSEEALVTDPRTAVARSMARYVGVPVTEASVARLRQVLAANGGSATLAQLRASAPEDNEIVAVGCVLGMRRRLRLDVSKKGLDFSSVTLVPQGEDA